MKQLILIFGLFLVAILAIDKQAVVNIEKTRMDYYYEYADATGIDWVVIATVDQFERNTRKYKGYCNMENILSFCIDPQIWSGLGNEITDDNNVINIAHFMGFGLDGDGDGYADSWNQEDSAYSFVQYMFNYGTEKDEIFAGLTHYYDNEKTMKVLEQIYAIINEFQTVDLDVRVFPIPKGYRADYGDNYGASRSFGGRRSHEGIDIFSKRYTPIVSTTYGVIDAKGWNRLGGYRIGVRDIYNTYEYYAHLSSFAKGLEVGDVVKPGQVIGYVGDTGYGKEGTRGKFVPHLHFGLYKYDGRNTWSFNPYRFLKKWPRK